MLTDKDLDGIVVRDEGETDGEYASRRAMVLSRLNSLKRGWRLSMIAFVLLGLLGMCFNVLWPHLGCPVVRASAIAASATLCVLGLHALFVIARA